MFQSFIQKHFTFKNILLVVLLLIFINLLYLNVIFIRGANVKTIEKIISAPVDNNVSLNDCNSECVDRKINAALSSVKLSVSITPIPTSTLAPISTPVPVTNSTTSTAVKEYYIPFGGGNGGSKTWQDVAGLQANVDSGAYGTIQSVIFEVSMYIPTGNQIASVRLYNATDGYPINGSQLDFNGNSSSVFKASNSVSLGSGNKLYKVQIQTQLGYSSIIDQSRIHITTN